jgi:CRISPR system Cascade subunit CasA
MPYDLLNDPLIHSDREALSLPGVMAAMARGEVASFPALRPHQRPAWHMFLVQLAVLALDAAGRRDLPEDEATWRATLRGLTTAFPGDEPWCLVVADRARPAFLQPPDPGGLKWTTVATPDALDMVITARNHDVKREIARDAAPEDWIFALVSLQTMEGFGGAGNYGIARMNGGSSSRVLIGLAPAVPGGADVDLAAWWRRDVLCLLEQRTGAAGLTLLWLEPWPDGHSFDLADLDPLFIEVCRRIRLVAHGERLTAERSTSKAARIAAKEAKGNTGDPWAPVHLAEGKALTLGERDWTHELLVSLLFPRDEREWSIPLLARPSPDEERRPMVLVAEAFARGNSKTEGFRSRVVPVPKAMVADLFGERPAMVADDLLKDIAAVDAALRNGLAQVAAGGDADAIGKPQYARTRPARDALRREADRLFFPELWRRVEARVDDDFTHLRLTFLKTLAEIARREFGAAVSAIPCAAVRRPRAEVRGRAALERGLHMAMRNFEPPEVVHA